MKQEDIEYLRNKLAELNDGKRYYWNLRDRQLVSMLLVERREVVIVNARQPRTFTSSSNSVILEEITIGT